MIHTNQWIPDTCTGSQDGCCIEYTWDDADSPETRTFTHRRVIRLCSRHAAFAGEEGTHRTRLLLENRRKYMIVQRVEEALPGVTVSWYFTPEHILHIVLAGATNQQRNALRQWVQNNVPDPDRIVVE